MKNIEIVSKVVSREGEAKHSPSKDISSANLSDYLLKSIWDKVWEIRTDSQGKEYIFGKLPVVTQYGITMYSGDGVDVPSLASGLPFDGRTIWYNPDTQQIEVIGGTGGGSGEGVSNFWDLSGIPSWITNSKPKYTYSEIEGTPDLTQYALVSQIPSLSGYATESWVTKQNYATKATTLSGYGITDAYTKTNVDDLLKAYVTLGGTQTITGEKNFTGGLKVNGSPIYYDSTKKYWKLEGDLLVTGGVTMYGSDSSFTPSTIMDALLYDDATLGINSNGQLYVKGGAGGGINTTDLQNYLTQNSYLNITSGDNRYLKLSGGSMNGVITMPINYQIQWGSSSLMIYGEDTNDIKIVAPLGLYVNSKEVWHKGNFTPSNYLPLSGGTLSSNLTIQNKTVDVITLYRDDVNNSPSIKFTNKSDGTLGYIGVLGSGSYIGIQPFFMDSVGAINKIWHSGNFNPSNYLLLSGGTMTGNILLGGTTTNKIGTNIVDTTGGFQEFTHQNSHGYIAIGPFNGSVAHIYTDRPSFYFNKDLYVNNAKVWNASNDGSGSTLDADLLDGKHNGELTAIMLHSGGGFVIDANTIQFSDFSLRFYSGIPNTSTNLPTSSGYQNGLLVLPLHSGGSTAQIYLSVGKNPYFRSHHTYEWNEIAYKTDNVASATKLQTARTIWGQSFDGTGNVSGVLSLGGSYITGSQGVNVLDVQSNWVILGSGTIGKEWTTYIDGYNINLRAGSSVSSGIYVKNDGNVGIGTTSPSTKLDVIGKVKADALQLTRSNGSVAFTIAEESGTNGYNIIASGGTSFIRFYTNYTSGAEERMRLDSYGNLGIGTNLPSYKLHVVGNAYVRDGISMARSSDNNNSFFIGKEDSSSQNLQIVNSSGSGNIVFRTNKSSSLVDHFILQQGSTILYDNLTLATSLNDCLKIHSAFSGNWAAAITATNNSLNSGQHYLINIGYENSKYNSAWVGYCHSGVGSTSNRLSMGLNDVDDVVNIIATGYVGVGTTNPFEKFDIIGNLRCRNVIISEVGASNHWYYARIGVVNEGASPSYLNPAMVFYTMNKSYLAGTEVERMRICSGGNVSIGYSGDAGVKLYVNGNILSTGGITMYSDQRKKTILNHVELSLKDIANAPLIEHYYNGDDKKTTHVGSIAQYWASMNDWFCKLDNEGYYTMEIQNAALASAISIARELDRYETKTDKAIKKLKKRICELEEEVERLKAS